MTSSLKFERIFNKLVSGFFMTLVDFFTNFEFRLQLILESSAATAGWLEESAAGCCSLLLLLLANCSLLLLAGGACCYCNLMGGLCCWLLQSNSLSAAW